MEYKYGNITGKSEFLGELTHRIQSRTISNEYIHNTLFIKREILQRNFTKRQLNILLFLFELSYMFNNEEAIVPYLQDFELCGVSKTKAKAEIDKLVEMNVIEVSDNRTIYRIKNAFEWKAPYNAGYNEGRLQEIIITNGHNT
ncbi:replication protein [Priestia megaterium]|uniref:replication protein n=1 Tax=Priestia megaterium TaxID=1404 RepID=UPI002E1A572D|nr:replication protein [Priestia megaterium]MED3976102.1 replication protein [Priestia megaterium]